MIETIESIVETGDLIALISAFFISSMRLLPTLIMLPLFAFASLGLGILRGGILLTVTVFFLPYVYSTLIISPTYTGGFGTTMLLICKELVVGVILGAMISLPFWIASAFGTFIDAQSGELLGEMIDPGSGENTTSNSTFYLLLFSIIFLSAGMLTSLITEVIPKSYGIWPAAELFPSFSAEVRGELIGLIGVVFEMALVIVLPFFTTLLLIDIGMAYVARFVPSLSPFFLALSMKIMAVLFISIVYHPFLVSHFDKLRETVFDILR